jgi:hypothetical protein
MIDRGESIQDQSEVAQRLQTELEFRLDETGEWLVHDELTESNGLNGNEFLPTRVRVSVDGSRLEFGVFKEDLEKNLELARIAGQDAKDLDFVRKFWPTNHRISLTEDDELLYFGAAIEPTADDLEKQFGGIHNGLTVPMEAAARGITYEDTKNEDNLLRISVRDAEQVREHDHHWLFPEKEAEADEIEVEGDGESGCRDWWDRSAENLRTYSIETWETFVGEAATELRIGEKVYIGSGVGHLDANNRRGFVVIHDSGYAIDDATKKHEEIGKRWTLALPIPDEVDFKIVDDMKALTRATLTIQDDGSRQRNSVPEDIELAVSARVDDHQLTITSEDGQFEVKFFEPACSRCETPIWKFEWSEDSEEDLSPNHAASMGMGFGGDIIMDGGRGFSSGVGHYSVGRYEYGKRKTVCCEGCFNEIQEEFATEFPLARRENALAAVRAKLDEVGYADVRLDPEQVWPTWFGQEGDIDFFGYIEYERNGRKIIRRAGRPTLTYDGKVEPNMPSREYIEFR